MVSLPKDQKIEDLSLAYCEELISTHGFPYNEIKLWQINKYYKMMDSTFQEGDERKENLKLWFTKVKEWEVHQGQVLNSLISPDGEVLVSLDSEQIALLWKLFEKIADKNEEQKLDKSKKDMK